MFVVPGFTVIGVIPMKGKLKSRDQPLALRIISGPGRQKTRKESPLPTLKTASAFVRNLRTLLNEISKCIKTLGQLLIAVLLMLEFCKEQQHSSVSNHSQPWHDEAS